MRWFRGPWDWSSRGALDGGGGAAPVGTLPGGALGDLFFEDTTGGRTYYADGAWRTITDLFQADVGSGNPAWNAGTMLVAGGVRIGQTTTIAAFTALVLADLNTPGGVSVVMDFTPDAGATNTFTVSLLYADDHPTNSSYVQTELNFGFPHLEGEDADPVGSDAALDAWGDTRGKIGFTVVPDETLVMAGRGTLWTGFNSGGGQIAATVPLTGPDAGWTYAALSANSDAPRGTLHRMTTYPALSNVALAGLVA